MTDGRAAQGGLATTFLGCALGAADPPRLVAIKRLHAHVTVDEADLPAALAHEARVSAGIRSPHVVSVLDIGQEQQGSYLAMESLKAIRWRAFTHAPLPKATPSPAPFYSAFCLTRSLA